MRHASRTDHWIKVKNPAAPAVKRETERTGALWANGRDGVAPFPAPAPSPEARNFRQHMFEGITESDWPRDRKRATGKCEGRESYAEARPDTVALAKELHANRLSYRKIAAELAARGHLTGGGKPHAASAIQKMLG